MCDPGDDPHSNLKLGTTTGGRSGQHPGQNGVEFDGPLAGPEFGPGKDAGAEVDGSGIDNFDLRRLLRLGGQFGGEPLVQLIIPSCNQKAIIGSRRL